MLTITSHLKDTDRVFDKDKSVDQGNLPVTVAERIIPVTLGKTS